MAFGTPYLIGTTGAGSTSTSQTITPGTATSAGDAIIVGAGNSSSGGAVISGVADSQGNQYTAPSSPSSSNEFGQIWVATCGSGGPGTPTAALTTANTITVTYSAASGEKVAMAVGVSGASNLGIGAVDVISFKAATSAAPSVTTGYLGNATEIAIGFIMNAVAGGVPSGVSGWTQLDNYQNATTPEITSYYQTPGSQSPLTLSGTITSTTWFAAVITLQPSGAAPLPYLVGSGSSAASAATVVITTTRPTGAGDAIVVAAANSGAATVTGISDGTNTYTEEQSTTTQLDSSVWVANTANNSSGPAALPAGSTITVTYSASNTNGKSAVAGGAPGYNAVDVTPAPATSAGSASPAIASGTLAQAAEVIFFAFFTGAGGGAPSSPSNCLLMADTQASGDEFVTLAYQVVSSTASVTGGATVTSTKWAAMAVSLEATSSGTSVSLADVAGASDSLSVAVALPLPDVAGADDSITLVVTLPLADVGAGTDSVALAVAAAVADVAGAADVLAPAVALGLGDTGAAADSVSASVTLGLADVGAGTDSASASATLSLPDVAAAADAPTEAVALALADTAGAVEAMSLAAALALADAAGGVDTLLAAIGIAEAAGAVDTISVSISEAGQALPWFRAALMFARWRAAVSGPRWSAALMAERWRPMAGVRWPASLLPRRWGCELSTRTYNVTSTEQIPARVTAPSDPTGLEVQMAFLTSPPPAQPTTQWLAATWGPDSGPPWTALCLVGPGGLMQMTSGVNYYVWVQVTASPEVPVEYAGMLEAQ